MKTYRLSFQDKNQNELKIMEVVLKNRKEAKSLANIILNNSMLNDLHKIIVL
jgi:hypothetical protein